MADNPVQAPGAAAEWKANWYVVLAGALGMSLAAVALFSLGIFMGPLEAEFGWSRADISLGVTFLSMFGVVFAPVVGIAIDRWGARRIGMTGVIAFCLAFSCFSLVTSSLWSWWGLWLLVAVAAAGVKPTVWTAGISSLFVKGRGLAISVILCGSGLGSSLTPVVGNYFIERFGWRAAYPALGLFWALLVVPMVWLFFTSSADRSRSEHRGPDRPAMIRPAGLSAREGLLSLKFARMGLATFLGTLITVSLVANLVPILMSLQFTRDYAAGVGGSLGIATITGRLTGGYLLDRINGGVLGGICMLLPALACGILLGFPGSGPVVLAAVVILGLAMGAEVDAVAYLVTRHFGLKSFGFLFGVMTSLMALATSVGPVMVSYIYDMTKSYQLALIAVIPLSLVASLMFFSTGRYPEFETASE